MKNIQTRESYVEEYSAVRDGGAGLISLAARGRLLVSGSEAAMFLNGLITNDIKTLEMNSWMPAAFANVQGRLLAVVRVIHRHDGFLIDTEAATHETVLRLLERFTLAGDFKVADISTVVSSYSVQGRRAAGILKAVLGEDNVERQKAIEVETNGDQITIIRATHTSEDGFDLFVNSDSADQLQIQLIDAGANIVTDQTVETLRIEAGIARYGIDMDETTVVSELNLDDAISFNKGCYIGQEIIVRIKHRGHVAKRLAGIILEDAVTLKRGARVLSVAGKDAGQLTSSTFSPVLDRVVALGLVKYDFLAPGTRVDVVSENETYHAHVAELPLVRGSWYMD